MRRGRASADPAPETGAAAGEDAPHDDAPAGGVPAVPAGTDLDELVGAPPDTRRRSKVRRRLRHLRRVREVLLRDLGGFVFELHRAPGEQSTAETDLVASKLERIGRVDGELRDLEAELDDRRPMTVREPGIGGACAVCGELFGSEARFCWACGTPVAPGAVRPVSAVAAAATGAAALGVPELAQPQPAAAPPPPPPPAIPHIEGTSEEMPVAGAEDPTDVHDRGEAGTSTPDAATAALDRDAPATDAPPTPPPGLWDEPSRADDAIDWTEDATRGPRAATAGDEPDDVAARANDADATDTGDEPTGVHDAAADTGDEPTGVHDAAADTGDEPTGVHGAAADADDEPDDVAARANDAATEDERP